jgi:hypothetical protein
MVFLIAQGSKRVEEGNEQTDPRRVKSPVLYFTAVLAVRRVATPALPAFPTVVP